MKIVQFYMYFLLFIQYKFCVRNKYVCFLLIYRMEHVFRYCFCIHRDSALFHGLVLPLQGTWLDEASGLKRDKPLIIATATPKHPVASWNRKVG